jgi:hypothetical protein
VRRSNAFSEQTDLGEHWDADVRDEWVTLAR